MRCALVLTLTFVAVAVAVVAALATGPAAAADCQPDHPERSALLGHWSLVYTVSFVGESGTPEQLGYAADKLLSNDGTWESRVNGILGHSGTWCIRACEVGQFSGECSGQTVVQLEGGPAGPSAFEWSFDTTTFAYQVPIELPEGAMEIGYLAMDSPLEYYQWLGPVSTEAQTWTAVKARY